MADSYRILKGKISGRKAKICIIGLGYVGLPLALEFLRKGFTVFGYDKNPNRIEYILKKQPYIVDVDPLEVRKFVDRNKFFPQTSPEPIKNADVIIICVPTPLRKVKTPDISYIIDAVRVIKKFMPVPSLLVLESTTYPGTCRDVVLPILEKGGFKRGKDFFLGFSPERVDPGNKKYPLTKISKVVSGIDHKSLSLIYSLYSLIIKKVKKVSSLETAETVKLLENTFRLVNIGLINEFAMLCDKLGVNVWEVIDAAKTKPFGFMPFSPGPGIGGHCIPCDPLYLSWKARKVGFKTKMIDLASFVNRYMPKYIVERLKRILGTSSLKGKRILIIGVSYKKDVKDLRESPALDIIEDLQAQEAEVYYYDPYFPYLLVNGINMKSVKLTAKILNSMDCAAVITEHSSIDYNFLAGHCRVIFDTRNVYKKKLPNVITL